MKALAALFVGIVLFAANQSATVCAESETMDLKALAKKARPAVMLLVMSDANGKEIGTGTGFLVSSDGKLITNFHVVEKAANAIAKAENGGLFPIEGVLASDPKNDLVLLKLQGKDLPFLTLGLTNKIQVGRFTITAMDNVNVNRDPIEVGTRIAVIGSPLGLEGTMSEGIVSGVRELEGTIKVLQITAAISPGSSGSPVLNAKGDVVGVASSQFSLGQALNFAVPADVAFLLVRKAEKVRQLKTLRTQSIDEDEVIKNDPDWKASVQAQNAQDYTAELKHAQAVVRRYPEHALAHFGLGVAYLHLDFLDDAIVACKQAIKLKPEYAEAWSNLGTAYGNSGRTDDAIAAFKQAIKLKPEIADVWGNLGEAYKDSGREKEAQNAFQRERELRSRSNE